MGRKKKDEDIKEMTDDAAKLSDEDFAMFIHGVTTPSELKAVLAEDDEDSEP